MTRLRLLAVGALLVFTTLHTPRAAPADEAERCNFVVLVASGLGAGELGCYGSFEHETPHLDRLAAEGMLFRTCWATPMDVPSRVMLLTGQYAHRTGYFDALKRPLTPRADSPLRDIAARGTFANRLDAAGYATTFVGVWGLHGELVEQVRGCGFDDHLLLAGPSDLPKGTKHEGRRLDGRRGSLSRVWQPCLLEDGEYRPTTHDDFAPDLFADYVVEFIRRHRGERFLVYYPMLLPHTLVAHKPREPVPDPEHVGGELPGGLAVYVQYVDRIVGQITKTVDELDLAERTLILFTASSGTGGRSRGAATELGVRVPLLVRRPGTVPPGRVSAALVSLSDLYPTLMGFSRLAIAADHPVDGMSLVPTLRGAEDVVHRRSVFSYLGKRRLVRDDRWLLDGYARLWDCRLSREGRGYRRVRGDGNEEEQAARAKLEGVLAGIPGPEAVAPQLIKTRDEARRR